jgi:hypothetical protein
MINKLIVPAILLSCAFPQTWYSQHAPVAEVFVGSTPCNRDVNARLVIPGNEVCVYMKWHLTMEEEKKFTLLISYGDYEPNGMGRFAGGGKSIRMSGKISVRYDVKGKSRYKLFSLTSDTINGELIFIRMDTNILHLADANLKLVNGDASFGFILNRQKPIH